MAETMYSNSSDASPGSEPPNDEPEKTRSPSGGDFLLPEGGREAWLTMAGAYVDEFLPVLDLSNRNACTLRWMVQFCTFG